MLKDIVGQEIKEGDYIAYAIRWGHSSALGVYEILSIGKPGYGTGYIPVRAMQKELGSTWWKNKYASSLHGELFPQKALRIEREIEEEE